MQLDDLPFSLLICGQDNVHVCLPDTVQIFISIQQREMYYFWQNTVLCSDNWYKLLINEEQQPLNMIICCLTRKEKRENKMQTSLYLIYYWIYYCIYVPHEGNIPAHTKLSEKGQGESASDTTAALPCNLWWDHDQAGWTSWRSTMGMIFTCSPWRMSYWSRWMHLKETWPHGSPVLKQAPGRTCGPTERETDVEADLLLRLVTPWDIPHWSSLFLKTAPHGRHLWWSSSWRTSAWVNDSVLRSFMRTLSHGRNLTLEQRKNLRSPAHEEEGMPETMTWHWPPFCVIPALFWWRR